MHSKWKQYNSKCKGKKKWKHDKTKNIVGNDFQSTKIRKLNITGWILHTSNHAINIIITYNSEVNIAIATHLFNSVCYIFLSLSHTHMCTDTQGILGNLVKQIFFRWFCFNNKLWVTKHMLNTKKKAFEIYVVGGAGAFSPVNHIGMGESC